ncbi:DUF3298 and DUF4163 domain-containing protein [Carboxylicivirga linearis]|uniref:DUF3298 and DUF4163 domain-containing protein n=1 Tax=Carboxylicivirga linearis TaxID=1628157 RepID=A0ABS5JTP0_9BACT|nr:DUF3298 and DUF4163 domain-containing protein [Carboxylicivirga linearis]MBS2097736.1 DUF3298 and DUF4163 domain-containing protein [Carboxylicivirga linearis]
MKFTLILAASLLLLASCNCTRTSNDEWRYEVKQVSEETDNFKQLFNYPVFNNEFIDGIVLTEIEKESKQFKSDIGVERISENWKNEQVVNVEVFTSNDGKVSLLFYNYLFTGGAHGNTLLKSYVIDANTKELIDLADVLKGSYFENLQAQSRKQLKKKLGYEGFVDEGTETLSDFSHFVLSNDSIQFYFPQYQVASYADGIQEISFSLQELLKEGNK